MQTYIRNFIANNCIDESYEYAVCIVRDTINYSYRIMNLNEFSIWTQYFDSFDDAKDFIDNHPQNILNQEK